MTIVGCRLWARFSADHIIELDKGRVVEEDNHRALVQRKGVCGNLVNMAEGK